jgi:putative transposase
MAYDTKSLAREIGLEPRTTPVQSPQSNGMAEAFVRTIKRDYVRVSPILDARPVMECFLYGSSTTTAFTRTRRSAIVPRVSSSPHVNRDDLSDLSGVTTIIQTNVASKMWY